MSVNSGNYNESNDPNNDDFFNDSNEIEESKEKKKNKFSSALEASRKFNFKKYQHFVYSIAITLLSIVFFIFSLSTFIYHVVGIVKSSKSRSIYYWIVTIIGDTLGMFLILKKEKKIFF